MFKVDHGIHARVRKMGVQAENRTRKCRPKVE